MPIDRRTLLQSSVAATSAALLPRGAVAQEAAPLAFFLIGDTHFLASKDDPIKLEETSRTVTSRLADTLNKLPGSEIPANAGGGKVGSIRGVIHAGDVIDTGDKNGATQTIMQRTEWSAFEESFGLNGNDGRLKYPIYEVHGNHDSPGGKGHAIDRIIERNKKRRGLNAVSDNGLHYAWEWEGVRFLNLGITVGSTEKPDRKRRYAPRESLSFLTTELKKYEEKSPVVLTHHIDHARYSKPCDLQEAAQPGEWDSCDVAAYYGAIHERKIAAILYGHTHVRNVYRWNGTPSMKEPSGIPTFNNDNSSHFNSKTQAFLYFEIAAGKLLCREYATSDMWETGSWTGQTWSFSV